MREMWARRVAMLTGGLVVVFALVFAYTQNPPPRQAAVLPQVAPAAPSLPAPAVRSEAPSASSLIEAGQRVYADLTCARCHSIAGRGGARSPLDGVGARLSEAEISAWIVPHAKSAKGFQARHADIRLTPAQRDALMAKLG